MTNDGNKVTPGEGTTPAAPASSGSTSTTPTTEPAGTTPAAGTADHRWNTNRQTTGATAAETSSAESEPPRKPH